MRLTPENKAKVRARILSGAADVLRRAGYDAVTLDRVMESAGLTRGAFYAHFTSKADLLTAVVRTEHPLLRMLQARKGPAPEDLRREMAAIFAGYLDPANLETVFAGCSVAALTGDVARKEMPVRTAFGAAWDEIVGEMARGHPVANRAVLSAALTLATGAVTTAKACGDDAQRARVLFAAQASFEGLLATALEGEGA